MCFIMLTVCGSAELASRVTQFCCQSSIIQVVLTKHQIQLPHVWSNFSALLLRCTNLGFELEEMKKVDRVLCTPFVMKVDEKSGRNGEPYRGRINDCPRAHTQKIQLALTQEWASSRGPQPTVRPRDHDHPASGKLASSY